VQESRRIGAASAEDGQRPVLKLARTAADLDGSGEVRAISPRRCSAG